MRPRVPSQVLLPKSLGHDGLAIDEGYDNLMKLLEEGKFPKFGQ